MKVVLNTAQLQNLVTKAVKGAGNNKLLPMTSLMAISYDGNGMLSLTTTDNTNYLTVKAMDVSMSDDELEVVVIADNFAKLISRMTSETITFTHESGSFFISGGKSTYNIELPLDVDGSEIKFERPMLTPPEIETIKLSSIKSIINTGKSALATTLETPCYTAYYVGKNVISTDTYKICCIDEQLVKEPLLISSETMDLLDLAESDLEYGKDKDSIGFKSVDDTFLLITKPYDGLETYSVDAIMGLVESKFKSACVVKKNDILQALDRLAIFVSQYDRNIIQMSFTKNALVLKNKKSAGTEEIDYLKECDGEEFDCAIDIEMLISQIKANSVDDVTIYYGLPNCIKIADGNITQIIALSE